METKVSIIVPVYNAQEYLKRCVDSILSQDYRDFELLLMDDGSKDASGEICDAYAQQDGRVRVVHKENTGVSDTRNQALELARGTFLQFLDSDDWIVPEATRLLVRSMEEYNCDMVISDFYRVSGERLAQKGDIEEDKVMSRQEFASYMIENPADFYYGGTKCTAGASSKNIISGWIPPSAGVRTFCLIWNISAMRRAFLPCRCRFIII